MAYESVTTVDGFSNSKVNSFVQKLKLPNTGQAGTLYPLRKNLDLQNLKIFCVEVIAHHSYGTDWPASKDCSFEFKKIDSENGESFSNIIGADAGKLYRALPAKQIRLPLDSANSSAGQPSREEIFISCESETKCQISRRPAQ